MITFTWDAKARLLIMHVAGMISEADVDGSADAFQHQVPEAGVHIRGAPGSGTSLLLDWEKLDGWEMGAKTLATLTTKAIMSDTVRKVAVIADAKWLPERDRLADIYTRAEVRFFAPQQRQDAAHWAGSR